MVSVQPAPRPGLSLSWTRLLQFFLVSMRWRYALVVGCLLIVASIVFSNVIILSKLKDSTLNDVESNLARQSVALAAQANLSLQSLSLVLSRFSDLVAREGITDRNQFKNRLGGYETHQLLAEKIVGLPQIEAIALMDEEGTIVNSSRAWPMPVVSVADRDFFVALKKDPSLNEFVSAPFENRVTRTWTVAIAWPLHNAEGRFIGLLSGAVRLGFFENYWQSVLDNGAQGMSVSLNRMDGTVLARFPITDAIGKRFPDGVQNKLRDTTTATLRKLSPIDLTMRIESARVLGDFPIFILATTTEQAALESWYRTAQMVIAISLCCVVVVLIAAWGMWRWWREHEHRVRTQAEKSEAENAKLIAQAELHRTQEGKLQAGRLNAAIENMSQGLLMFDADERLVVVNDQFIQMYGLSSETVKPGCTFLELLRHRAATGQLNASPELIRANRLDQLTRDNPVHNTFETPDGRTISIIDQPMPGGGWVVTHADITAQRKVEARIAHMAHHDALTGLPNRVLLAERLDAALSRVPRGETLAVLYLDLDHFKGINDTLGHVVGDELLKVVAERLLCCIKDTDTVGRLSGDEFLIVLTAIEDSAEAARFAQRLREAIAAPIDLDGQQLFTDVSIGISIAPVDSAESAQLLKNADMALYRAKADGRGTHRFFHSEMEAQVNARRVLEVDLRNALLKGEFELQYQPVVNLERNEVSGFEALLRWNHPERGVVSPAEFIPVAEDTGLIIPIGDWVLRTACVEAATWPAGITVAVNVSPVQFKSQIFGLTIMGALAASGLSPRRLEIEITEAVLMQNSDATLATLHQLHDLGVNIAMDDFGTGYSSLSYLRLLPFNKIKIDRSFINDLADKDEAFAIVRAVVSLANSLKMTTTAEGVETHAQLERIRALGCTEMQGYLFSRAVPATQLAYVLALDPATVLSRCESGASKAISA